MFDPTTPTELSMAANGAGGRRSGLRDRLRRWPWIPIVILLVLLILPAIFAPWLSPHDPFRGDLGDRLIPPAWVDGGSSTYLLGTDGQGRDILTRIMFGARISMSVALSAIAIGLAVGGSLGLLAGYFGGFLDKAVMWLIDTFLALPFVLLALVVVAAVGPSFQLVIVLASATVWAYVARQIRGETLSIRESAFVARAKVAGSSRTKIILRHILPNTISPLIVVATLQVGLVILEETSLSFIGAGIPPPNPSWGVMVAGGRDLIITAWWVSFFPGLAILSVVLSLNLLGDWLRDYLDPKTRQQLLTDIDDIEALDLLGVIESVDTHEAIAVGHLESASAPAADSVVLRVKDLRTFLVTRWGTTRAVDGVDLELERSSTLGIVGESGSGKTMLGLSLVRLTPEHVSKTVSGEIWLDGRELLGMSAAELRRVRSRQLSMIFQDPQQSLNPVFTVGSQLGEAIRAQDRNVTRSSMRQIAVDALQAVHVPDAESRLDNYPHQLSGGMKQRVVSAMAMLGEPKLIVADEPTTALDATIQAQFLNLLKELQRTTGVALIIITHDFDVVAETCSRVAVMYAGRIVEQGPVGDIFDNSRHPYTRALLEARPNNAGTRSSILKTIDGQPPSLVDLAPGCRFAPRCLYAEPDCVASYPPEVSIGDGHSAWCWRAEEQPWMNHSSE
jgi:peptide/nickel transport system permease protein